MKKVNLIKKNYFECFDFVFESRKFIYSIIGIFFFLSLVGFFLPVPEELSNVILEFIEQLLEQTKGMSAFELMKFLFFNNVKSSFFGMLFGLFFGAFSILAAVFNGYLLGFVASMSVASEGFFSLWKIFPHGIFELPAIFISLGLGLRLGLTIFSKKERKNFRENFGFALKTFFLIVFPLLVIAAFIEGFLIFLMNN